MLPWEFIDEFEDMDIDINDPMWGRWLDNEAHDRLHLLGWNDEWRTFLSKDSNLDPRKVRQKVIELSNDSRFKTILKKGRKTLERYPNEESRRANDLMRSRAGKKKVVFLFEAIGVLLTAQNLADAAAGGCDCHLATLSNDLVKLNRYPSQANCQEAMWSMYKYFECAGFDDLPNAVQFKFSVSRICTNF